MRRSKSVAVIILLLGLLASSVAWAHRSHHGAPGGGFHHHHGHGGASVGVVIGTPWLWPYYSPPPTYLYYPPLAAAPASPPVYIEQGNEQGDIEAPSSYWFYCGNPKGYYPYLKDCPGGWQQVPAQPQPSSIRP
jgi:hypothetical protein